jgi:hypothetical protein
MKRTRRVSVEIEHREISIFLRLSESNATGRPERPPDAAPIPATCPICGAAWVFVTPKAGDSQGSPIEQVSSVFEQLGLHPPLYAGGMFLICRHSFDQMREKL